MLHIQIPGHSGVLGEITHLYPQVFYSCNPWRMSADIRLQAFFFIYGL